MPDQRGCACHRFDIVGTLLLGATNHVWVNWSNFPALDGRGWL